MYTPVALADWIAERALEALPERPATFVDFACGRGALLAALQRKARGLRLVGVDVSGDDLSIAAQAVPRARLVEADALLPDSSVRSPRDVAGALEIAQVDGVVLNPPWGVELATPSSELRSRGYELARGQYDSASLFVELSLSVLREGGVAALILPDSVFSSEHAPLRQLLVERSQLLLLARLGEGFFPGVFRGTAVIVLRNRPPAADHEVECLHVATAQRRALLAGSRTFAEVARRAHAVPQSRFAGARGASFDIRVRRSHEPLIERMRGRSGDWSRWFDSGRGVELSKTGAVSRCTHCDHARPAPRGTRPLSCAGCGEPSDPADLREERIVRPRQDTDAGWAPLVVGDDVDRYRCRASREILTGVSGINYKPGHEAAGARVLVRKTGMGLRAALARESVLTTQVVFHYRPIAGAPELLAEYALGVLSSRAMLAFHLLTSGESEWRSHPYVTQRILNALPIPDPDPESPDWAQVEAIASRVAELVERPDDGQLDLELEGLVAGLFGLSASNLETIATALRGAQDLEGIRELRFDARAVTPRVV